ncbi:hypothetical protein [Lyngbya aestuarii]|uniref:hypothetical protein n=1 Tax=Lyngbya aestuarii TaxID=118322 RepID=UPI00403E0F22
MTKQIQKPPSELTAEEKAKIARCLPDGVDAETMAHFLYFVSRNFRVIQETYGKVKPWGTDAEDIKWFLTFFSEGEYIERNQQELIPVNRIFSKPWNEWRLALALAHRKLGQKAPPIRVHAYCLEDQNYWYTVDDGMHRTTAAKMANQPTIEAIVIAERAMPTKHYYLDNGYLFKLTNQGSVIINQYLPKGYYNYLEDLFCIPRRPQNLMEFLEIIIKKLS